MVRAHAVAATLGVSLAVLAAGPATAAAPGTGGRAPNPVPGARLQGSFLLAGRIKVTGHVRGEHTGQTVLRTWQFQPDCPAGPCQTVTLTRPRSGGVDTVVLQQTKPGYYVGRGHFDAPLRCAGRVYRRGERVPFKITVIVTTAITDANGVLVAGRLYTTYVNPVRINVTRCVAVLGHDAATYHGHIVAGG